MISQETIAEAAELFDRFNNSLDPGSPETERAEHEFNAKIYALHSAHASEVDFRLFRYELIAACRKYLAKN